MMTGTVTINCDMGEAFGLYSMGDDEAIMPFITEANIACGFHASDPTVMHRTVRAAKQHGIRVGAHPSLPDLQGFGRREMKVEPQELTDLFIYQVGALKGFLDAEGMPLAHIKPHGAIFGMATRSEALTHAICDAVEVFGVPLYGLAGTLHEKVCRERNLPFVAEFYSDLDYADDGTLVITRVHHAIDPTDAAERCLRAIQEEKTRSLSGADVPVRAESICVHSDTPGAIDIARAVHSAVAPYLAAR
jgi:UPF0271 protein